MVLFKKKRREQEEPHFEIQITALIDTLIILVIFLLKTTSVEILQMEREAETNLPLVSEGNKRSINSKLRLSINKDGLFWNGEKVIVANNFELATTSETGWQNLSQKMKSSAAEVEEKAEKESKKFDGDFFLEADKETPYPLLSKALATAKKNGLKNIKFVGVRYHY